MCVCVCVCVCVCNISKVPAYLAYTIQGRRCNVAGHWTCSFSSHLISPAGSIQPGCYCILLACIHIYIYITTHFNGLIKTQKEGFHVRFQSVFQSSWITWVAC